MRIEQIGPTVKGKSWARECAERWAEHAKANAWGGGPFNLTDEFESAVREGIEMALHVTEDSDGYWDNIVDAIAGLLCDHDDRG